MQVHCLKYKNIILWLFKTVDLAMKHKKIAVLTQTALNMHTESFLQIILSLHSLMRETSEGRLYTVTAAKGLFLPECSPGLQEGSQKWCLDWGQRTGGRYCPCFDPCLLLAFSSFRLSVNICGRGLGEVGEGYIGFKMATQSILDHSRCRPYTQT